MKLGYLELALCKLVRPLVSSFHCFICLGCCSYIPSCFWTAFLEDLDDSHSQMFGSIFLLTRTLPKSLKFCKFTRFNFKPWTTVEFMTFHYWNIHRRNAKIGTFHQSTPICKQGASDWIYTRDKLSNTKFILTGEISM